MRSKADHKRSYANRLGFVAEHGGPPTAPSNEVLPTISGDAEVGGTLIYVPGEWIGVPVPGVTALWFRAGQPDGPATTPREITDADIGAAFAVRETAVSLAGSVAALSLATAPVPEPEPEES